MKPLSIIAAGFEHYLFEGCSRIALHDLFYYGTLLVHAFEQEFAKVFFLIDQHW
jgi:hypothetical protein